MAPSLESFDVLGVKMCILIMGVRGYYPHSHQSTLILSVWSKKTEVSGDLGLQNAHLVGGNGHKTVEF